MITKIVDQGGTGNYLTLKDLCDDLAGVSGGDLVTAQEILFIDCRCTNGVPDPGGADFDVFTTNVSYYVWLHVYEQWRPRHVWTTGNYFRIEYTATTSGSGAFKMYCNFMMVSGLYIYITGPYNVNGIMVKSQSASNWILIQESSIHGTVSEATTYVKGIYLQDPDTNLYVRNCVMYDCKTANSGSCGIYADEGTAYVHHCTAVNCGIGFASDAGNMQVKNCGAQDCDNGFWGTFNANSDYNASDIASDAPGANSRNGSSGTVAFKDASGKNFALAEADTNWRGQGTDLTSDPILPVVNDVDWTARRTFDIGFYEFLAADGAIQTPVPTMGGQAEIGAYSFASGQILVPATTMSGAAFRDFDAPGEIVIPGAIMRGECTLQAPLSSEDPQITIIGFETFPLRPGFVFQEGIDWQTLQTPPEAGAVMTRAADDRPMRKWRLVWNRRSRVLNPDGAEMLRSFERDHLTRPFYLELPHPIARPYSEPTLGSLGEGSLSSRTVYVGYTWGGDTGETQISCETSALALPENALLTVTVPKFPINVTKAWVYVGATADTLKKQVLPITQSGGTWKEPAAGYDTGGATVPTSNTLTEAVLVQFADRRYRLRQVSGVGYEAEVYLQEYFETSIRAFYASGEISVPATTMSGVATVPVQMCSGAIIVPATTMAGTATYQSTPPAQTDVEGAIVVPVPYVSGVVTLAPAGDLFVAKTGSDSNPGTYALPFLTIQKALNVATPGQTIIIQTGTYTQSLTLAKPNVTLRGVGYPVIDGANQTYSLRSSGVSDGCTFDRLMFTNSTYGLSSSYDADWVVSQCLFSNISTRSIDFIDGTRHRITDCEIHDMSNDNEAMGVKLAGCTSCLVEGCKFWLIRKEAIRDIGGVANTIVRNHVQACGMAIALNSETKDALVRDNYGYMLGHAGLNPKHTLTGTGRNRMIYNTMVDCAFANMGIAVNVPIMYGVEMKRNLLQSSRGDFFAMTAGDSLGSNIVIDENMFWEVGGGPRYFGRLENWGGNINVTSIASWRSYTGWEVNGVMYSPATVDQYGASGYATPVVTYVPIPVTAVSASSGLSSAQYTTNWSTYTGYESSSASNEWIVYDIGYQTNMNVFQVAPWMGNDERSPRDILIQTSNSQSGPWDTRVDDTLISRQVMPNIWHLSSPVNARYVRLYMTNNQGGSVIWFSIFEVGYLT